MKKEIVFKRLLLALFISVLAVMLSADSSASALNYNGFEYTVIGEQCVITGSDDSVSGDVVIPDVIEGKVVTSIAESAFENKTMISTIVIPVTIESIGDSAFSGCSNLISFNMPDSVSALGKSVFRKCNNLKEVKLSGNIQTVPEKTFEKCVDLEKVILSDNVVAFGEDSFSGCESLRSFVFPESISAISAYSFYDCKSLEWIYLPSTVTFVGSYAFGKCSSLSKVYYSGQKLSKDFSLSGGNTYLSNSEWIFGHNHEETHTLTNVDPTCEDVGYTVVVCKCGHNRKVNYIDPFGHNYSLPKSIREPDCQNGGLIHLHCSRCNSYTVVETPPTAHKAVIDNAVAADCYDDGLTEGSHCYVCKTVIAERKIVPALGHNYTRKVQSKACLAYSATYSKPAKYYYSCSRCSAVGGKTFNGDKLLLGKPKEFISSSTSNSITLSWSKVADADLYGVYYKDSQGKWKLYKAVTVSTITIKSLPSGKKYDFAVKAYVKENGTTIASPYFCTLTEATRPLKPEKIVAKQNQTMIKLTWSASSGATGYRVYVYNTKTSAWAVVVSGTKNCSIIKEDLTNGTYYKFAVRSYIDTGKKIVWSDSYTAITTSTKPLAPTLKATSLKGGIRLQWDAVIGADGYVIYGSTKPDSGYTKLAVTKNLTFTKSGLTSGKTYYFKAYSVKKLGNGYVYSYAGKTKAVTTK